MYLLLFSTFAQELILFIIIDYYLKRNHHLHSRTVLRFQRNIYLENQFTFKVYNFILINDLIPNSAISASFPTSASFLFRFKIAFKAHLCLFSNIEKQLNCHCHFGYLSIILLIKFSYSQLIGVTFAVLELVLKLLFTAHSNSLQMF